MSETRSSNTLTLAVFLMLVGGAALLVAIVLFVRAGQRTRVENKSLAAIHSSAEQERRAHAERASRMQSEVDALTANLAAATEALAEAEERAELLKNQDEPLRRKAGELYREKVAAENNALDARKELAATAARLKQESDRAGVLQSSLAKEQAQVAALTRDNQSLTKQLEEMRKQVQLLAKVQADLAKSQAEAVSRQADLATASAEAAEQQVKLAAAEKSNSELLAEAARLQAQIKALQQEAAERKPPPAATK